MQGDADGAALVSGRLLAEITKALPAKPVDIAAVGAHLELVCGSARFTLPTMPVEDYPTLPEMPESAGTVDAAAFAAAVAQVAIAAGRDETLPMMTGVRMELDGSHAGDARHRPLPARAAGDRRGARTTPRSASTRWCRPGRWHDTAKTLGPLGGEVTVALSRGGVGEGMIGFAGGTRRTTSRLLDGPTYPPGPLALPGPAQRPRPGSPVAALIEVVKRVALVAERTTPVRLSFSADGDWSSRPAAARTPGPARRWRPTFTGEPLTVGFNPQYLIDGLAVWTRRRVLSRSPTPSSRR